MARSYTKKKELTPEELAVQAAKKRTDELLQAARKEAHKLGRDLGRQEGIKTGREEGIAIGKREGIEIGKEKGYKQGYMAGEEYGVRIGQKEGALIIYPGAFSEGKIESIKKLVTSIETQMAKAAGYQDRETWLKEGTVPAWWTAVLIENWEPSLRIRRADGRPHNLDKQEETDE